VCSSDLRLREVPGVEVDFDLDPVRVVAGGLVDDDVPAGHEEASLRKKTFASGGPGTR
jgi:hypothetical protein